MSILKIISIETRHGKPIADVIAGMVLSGMKIPDISEELFMSQGTIQKVVELIGLDASKKFSHGQSRPGRKNGRQPTYVCVFKGVSSSISRHCKRNGLSDATVYRLIWGGMTPDQALAAAYNKKHGNG